MAASGWDSRQIATPKVFVRNGYIIGYTDSFRMGQILEHHLDLPECDYALPGFMVAKFIPLVRSILKDCGYMKIENNQETGGTFLVGCKGELYTIYSDFSVQKTLDGFNAIGCGASYALGALKVILPSATPEDAIIKALQVAGYFSNGVCEPYYVKALD